MKKYIHIRLPKQQQKLVKILSNQNSVSTSLPYEATEISSNSSSTSSKSKHDPLRMFREIYLDENIKIEMFHPQSSGGDTGKN